MRPDTRYVLNKSCGWSVAFWLLLCCFASPWWAGAACIIGAVVTVMVWAGLTRYLEDRQ